MNRQLLLLALCQGFFLTNNVTFIAINGLVGLRARAERVAGDAAGHRAMSPAARCAPAWSAATSARGAASARSRPGWWWRCCRRRCAPGPRRRHNFWLLVGGALAAGYYNANAGLYRFAATEIVEPAFKERAISWVLAGGIIGAVVGPNLASVTRDAAAGRVRRRLCRRWSVVALLALATLSFIHFPPLPLPSAARARPAARARSRASRSSSSPSPPVRSATA